VVIDEAVINGESEPLLMYESSEESQALPNKSAAKE